MNLDAPLVRGNCQADQSSSLENPAVLSNKSGTENDGGEPEKQDSVTVQNMQMDQLDARIKEPCSKLNDFDHRKIENVETVVKDTVENASFTAGQVNGEPSPLLGKGVELGLDGIDNRTGTFEVGVGYGEPPPSLGKGEYLVLALESRISSSLGNLGSSHIDATENTRVGAFESTLRVAVESTVEFGLQDKGTASRSRKRKSTTKSSVTTNRVLRSRSKTKSETPEPNDNTAEVANDSNGKRKRRKQRMNKNPVNEFSRIRSHLRYLLHRIKYEQNLIDAYSGEGWKGQSIEKLKPEKELQRAKSHILRYKLKIRDLFQRLDASLVEGKLPECLFDSEGEIDSEDIFCAKCGSKDLPDNNDIILCDGACERGFHQYCLEPPLLKEDIPPGDEGWLCPGCDCKLDCLDLLNDFHGTSLSVVDSFEKVFPEAAAASGKTLDDVSGLPSDDSGDDDYDPDKPELDEEELEEDGPSSDDSDYFSASDGHAASPNNDQQLGLPSEDSEDDDFDPDAPDRDEQVIEESSSSDFSSDSEDLGALLDGDPSQDDNQYQTSDVRGVEVKVKQKSLKDELSYLLESIEEPVSGKRHVQRLDYKMLHDETYGNVSSDSSDNDYGETSSQRRRKNGSRKISGKDHPDGENGDDIEPEACDPKLEKRGRRRGRNKDDAEDRKFFSTSHGSSSEAGSGKKSSGRVYKKLGEEVTQRLFKSFKKNQYPKRPDKENLAKELGLSIQQVSKWFENARWSSRHSASVGSNTTAGASSGRTSLLQPDVKSPSIEPKTMS